MQANFKQATRKSGKYKNKEQRVQRQCQVLKDYGKMDKGKAAT